MSKWTISVSICDVLILFGVFTGVTFAALLFFSKRVHQTANRCLGLALLTLASWLCWVLGVDTDFNRYAPLWSWVPLQYSLTLGPLIWLYVQLLTSTRPVFHKKYWWHFSPFLIEQGVFVAELMQAYHKRIATYDTALFWQLNPVLQLLGLISVLTYLLLSIRSLNQYHQRLADQFSDTDRYQFRRLKRLLAAFGLIWILWIPYFFIDFFLFNYHLSISAYYPLYLLLAGTACWLGIEAFLRPEYILAEISPEKVIVPAAEKEIPTDELLQRITWLRAQVEENLLYMNAGLTLRDLGEFLAIHPNELSYLINTGTGKNFNDFINTYRVEEVQRRIIDPTFDHITLLGIAYDCGFNSKTTFNRTFKQITGKSPAASRIIPKTATIL
ncbi:helix-turn-helix domain-containing protein [Mucilaginibacter sp. X4EP1]|uniref:helix-turn-helix domain-containing protein n=1 Tax=Mucilaginibacter sp. X4EP1 TaxID=2723092 RepID=UPI00216A0E65|nr:AraC family transcriptional regulator [Mucilaginibacter sp. X4EP1]MCS3815958.1 AraC-like DNA-binding protein [Mucilaginibacter sp. X4EP1]